MTIYKQISLQTICQLYDAVNGVAVYAVLDPESDLFVDQANRQCVFIFNEPDTIVCIFEDYHLEAARYPVPAATVV